MSDEVEHPECDRMLAVHDKSQAIGEFLEWLSDQGVSRMRFGPMHDRRICPRMDCNDGVVGYGSRERPCANCDGEGFIDVEIETWYPDGRSISALLAEFFDIDLAKVEQERRAILDRIRQIPVREKIE